MTSSRPELVILLQFTTKLRAELSDGPGMPTVLEYLGELRVTGGRAFSKPLNMTSSQPELAILALF